MSAPGRWGDSDSSSEDESSVTDLPKQESEGDNDGFFDAVIPTTNQSKPLPQPSLQQSQTQRRAPPPKSNNYNIKGRAEEGGRDNHQQQQRGRARDNQQRGPTGGGRQQPHQQDWKSMAKSANKYTPASLPTVDGTAWMTSRRAKLKQQEEDHAKKVVEETQQQDDLNRQHRKSQMEALKLAMVERQKQEATLVTFSSLQASTVPKTHTPTIISVENIVSVQPKVSVTSRGDAVIIRSTAPSGGDDRGDNWRSKDVRVYQGDDGKESWRSHDIGVRRGRGGRSYDNSGGRGRGTQDSSFTGGGTQDTVSGHGGRTHDSGGRGRGGRGGHAGGVTHFAANDTKRTTTTTNTKGQIQVSKPQVVRTPSGEVQFHYEIGSNNDKPNTQGELLPNGSVRLSKKSAIRKGKKPPSSLQQQSILVHHDTASKSPLPTKTHTTLKTTLEIGKD